MNDLDLCLEVVSRLCQSLHYNRLSRKPLQKTPIGNGMWAIKWLRDRWHHVTPKELWGSTVGYPGDSLASYKRFIFFIYAAKLHAKVSIFP